MLFPHPARRRRAFSAIGSYVHLSGESALETTRRREASRSLVAVLKDSTIQTVAGGAPSSTFRPSIRQDVNANASGSLGATSAPSDSRARGRVTR